MIRLLDKYLHKPTRRRCVVSVLPRRGPFVSFVRVMFYDDRTRKNVAIADLLHMPQATTDAEIDLALRHGLTVREVRARFDQETTRIAKALGLRVNDVRRARA